jgi:uncharacterized delta-60 repeat protein
VQEGSTLTRLNPDGSVDTSFGTQGKIDSVGYASTATELPSGQILVAGTGSGGTHVTFYFVDYKLIGADGSAGGGPGSEGQMLSLPGDGGGVSEIAPGPDGGSLIVGGNFLLELRADGTPNPAFGANGFVVHRGLSLVGARVLPDGSVHAVGTGPGHDGEDLLYIHLTAAGQPDPAFGSEGARLFDLGGEEEAHAATWGADGAVFVGGAAQPHGACFEVTDCEEVPILAAFDPAGSLEPAFGTGGVVRLEALRGRTEHFTGNGVELLTRRPDGSLVAAGSASPEKTVAFLAALSPQGVFLPGFGEGGIVRERRATPAEQTIAGIVPAGQGGMLALGNSTLGVDSTPLVIRYASDGSLDGSFGDGAGYVVLGETGYTTGFADDGHGHLLTTLSDYPRSRLVKIRSADGAPEASFGSNGAVTLPKRIFTEAVAFAADGGAIVMGSRDVSGPAEPGVVLRYDRDGKPDRRFGKGGRVDLIAPGRREMRARALATVPGDRTLVAGFSHHSYALVRLLRDGRPDPRFGSRGWTLTAVGGQQLTSRGGRTRAVALGRDGSHIYLAGVTRDGKRFGLTLLRFHRDGQVDRSFARNGRRTVSIPQAAEPNAIVPTRHGALVVLNGGLRPLVTFANDGRVRQRSVGRGPELTNVRAAVSGGRLALGWNARIPAYGNAYYLGEQPLRAR